MELRTMESSIRIARVDEKTIITLRGTLDQELALNLIGTAQKTEAPVTLNLKQVAQVTAAGSYAILTFYQLHKQKPEIQGANSEVISLLNLTGTSRYITLAPGLNANNTAQE